MNRPHRRGTTRPCLEALEDRTTPVANDLFADAEVLTGQTAYVPFTANYDVFGTGEPFTAEPGEPDHAGVSDPVQSAWYSWTAPISGRAFVESFVFTFPDPSGVVAVYTGDAVDDLTEVTSDVGEFGGSAAFDAVAGTTYSIAVDSPGAALIEFELYLAVFEPPANDDFAAAFTLSGAPAPATVAPDASLSGSTTEVGEPNHATGIDFGVGQELTLGPSVWFSWTAPTTGRVTLDLGLGYDFGETFITGVAGAAAVYTGGAVDSLALVANAGGFVGPDFGDELRLSFDAAAGITYRIAVAGGNLFPNTLDLTLINHAVPGAVAIDGTLFVVGTAKNDTVRVTPVGTAGDGSTGVRVRGNYGGRNRTDTFAQPIGAAEMYLFDGNNTAELTGSLAFHVEAEFGGGHDTFRGGRGDTLVRAGAGNNSVRTGDGVDFVSAGDGNNDVRTGGGDDVVRVGKGNNTIATGDGDDVVIVAIPQVIFEPPTPGTGANVIDTGAGDDRVNVLSDGPSLVTTGTGDDSVFMEGSGNDAIWAGDGNDFVQADAGNNAVFTGAGDDTVSAGLPSFAFGPQPAANWSNLVDAGDGNDRVSVNSNGPTVVFAGAGNDDVTIGFQAAFGPEPPPPLTGPAAVFGGDGDDVLIGGAGKDLLDGGAGKDILVGGFGADVLLGGAGPDVLFDGVVTAGSPFAPPPLRAVFTVWDPVDPATYDLVRSKLLVTPDTKSRDVLLGGADLDWFWSDDPLDLLDITPVEVRN
jgi:hypothetical protein